MRRSDWLAPCFIVFHREVEHQTGGGRIDAVHSSASCFGKNLINQSIFDGIGQTLPFWKENIKSFQIHTILQS